MMLATHLVNGLHVSPGGQNSGEFIVVVMLDGIEKDCVSILRYILYTINIKICSRTKCSCMHIVVERSLVHMIL